MEREEKIIATNRKARHLYFIQSTVEVGIVLTGTEVKSLREGKANLADSYAVVKDGELWLHNFHISPFKHGGTHNHEPMRVRKLLAHKKEIRKLSVKLKEKGFTLVPLRVYFSGRHVKVELGLARGKKMFDKRESVKRRDTERELQRYIKRS
ncbi:MAG: SsrA-binding protein SmpB [Chlorobi bacterium]|nr:SsrA-binding protein SmpB [Chlorobiota bacterium]